MSNRSRWKTTAAAVASAAALGTLPPNAPASAAPGPCPQLYVVAVPGTWETSEAEPAEGLLAASADGLPGDVRVDYIPYAATAFPWETEVYGRSKHEALTKTRTAVAAMARTCASTDIALLGYSQGADAAGDLAAEIGTGVGVVPPERVALVGLISDPRRSPADTLIGPSTVGAGAGGPRPGGLGGIADRTYTFCAVGDLYCAMPPGDFAGRIAGFLAEISNPDPARFDDYARHGSDLLGAAVEAGGLGLLAGQFAPPALQQRRTQIEQFLSSGVHQSYSTYVVDSRGATAVSWLRDALTRILTR